MTENNITVRLAESTDLARILEIENASFSDPWTEDMFLSHTASKSGVTFVATLDEIVCGYLNAYIIDGSESENDGDCEIANIAVSLEFRRKHIADALITAVFDLAKKRFCSCAFLEVRESNSSARALYIKNGFAEYGKRKNYYTNPREDAILMSRNI